MLKKVLIVEDSASVLAILSETIKEEEYDVVTAESGEDGLKVFESEQPDIVVLDTLLPGIDGFELIVFFDIREERITYEMPTCCNFRLGYICTYTDKLHC